MAGVVDLSQKGAVHSQSQQQQQAGCARERKVELQSEPPPLQHDWNLEAAVHGRRPDKKGKTVL